MCHQRKSPLFCKRSVRVEYWLQVALAYFRQVSEPTTRGAKPVLIAWDQFIPLMNGPHTQSNRLGAASCRCRVNRRPAILAEGLLSAVSALGHLHVNLRCSGNQSEGARLRLRHGT